MRTKKISFPGQQSLCVFPRNRSELALAISELHLKGNSPVIVLIGGEIDKKEAETTRRAIHTISKAATDMKALVICRGTDSGVMSQISRTRTLEHHTYPLIGIMPEALATWPGGPRSINFLGWGRKRRQLDPHYSHFILVPGRDFGNESPWIVDAATILSKGHRSVTILINGSEFSRRDIDLSLENERPVIAVSRTGRLADELSSQPDRNQYILIAPANAEDRMLEVMHETLLGRQENALVPH